MSAVDVRLIDGRCHIVGGKPGDRRYVDLQRYESDEILLSANANGVSNTTRLTIDEALAIAEWITDTFAPPDLIRCPDCNGDGVVSVMNADPSCSETTYNCERCVEHKGLVPADSVGAVQS